MLRMNTGDRCWIVFKCVGGAPRARRCQGSNRVTLDVPAPSLKSEFNFLSGILTKNGSSSVW
jgi:hypothetical protein